MWGQATMQRCILLSRATLNITRAEMAAAGHCPSGRFFEAAACGTPVLTDTWPGLNEFFAEDELFAVKSCDDVLRVLALPDAELQTCGVAGPSADARRAYRHATGERIGGRN